MKNTILVIIFSAVCFALNGQSCAPTKNKKGDYVLDKITLQSDNTRAHILLSTFKADHSIIFTIKVEGDQVCFDSSTQITLAPSGTTVHNDNIDNCQGVFISFMQEEIFSDLLKSESFALHGTHGSVRFSQVAQISAGLSCLIDLL